MPMDRTERLNGIVAALNDYIDVVRAYDLEQTAALLRMVKLDLQMHIHDISHEELQALCEAVEEGQAPPAPAAAAPAWAIATPAWFCRPRRSRIAFCWMGRGRPSDTSGYDQDWIRAAALGVRVSHRETAAQRNRMASRSALTAIIAPRQPW